MIGPIDYHRPQITEDRVQLTRAGNAVFLEYRRAHFSTPDYCVS